MECKLVDFQAKNTGFPIIVMLTRRCSITPAHTPASVEASGDRRRDMRWWICVQTGSDGGAEVCGHMSVTLVFCCDS